MFEGKLYYLTKPKLIYFLYTVTNINNLLLINILQKILSSYADKFKGKEFFWCLKKFSVLPSFLSQGIQLYFSTFPVHVRHFIRSFSHRIYHQSNSFAPAVFIPFMACFLVFSPPPLGSIYLGIFLLHSV